MLLFDQLSHVLIDNLKWFALFAVLFGTLSYVAPCNPGMQWWRRGRSAITDMLYWFVMPLIMRFFRIGLMILIASYLYGFHGQEEIERFMKEGYGPLNGLPFWWQAGIYLLLSDVYLYFVHRFFHTHHAWHYHAVHHAPEHLDWTSTARFHPVNQLASATGVDIVMMVLGISPAVIVFLAPFNLLYSAMVHANVNWTFGPLRYVFASPVFHRWHHTTEMAARDKNFAATFPFLDLAFGTFYMPEGRLPEIYGNDDEHFPEGFFAQIIYPFLSKQPAEPVREQPLNAQV